MMVIGGALEPLTGGADPGCCRLVIHAFGPGKDPGYGQIASAMLKLHVHRVVMGIAVPVAVDIETGEIRIRQPARVRTRGYAEVYVVSSRVLLLTEREAGRRNRERLSNVAAVEKVDRMGSDVVDFQSRVPGKLALGRHIPRLDIGIDGILRLDHRQERQRRCGERGQVGETRELLVAQLVLYGGIGTGAQIVSDTVGVDICGVVNLSSFSRVEEDSVTAAHHRVGGQAIGEAESWGKGCL